ncbi:unnamed protein product [marine sediment metagenome]|uniref:DUF5050 domain-containing protein n=1 Tax=marine sediment metagenome TaxID=412755 RepID=X0SFG9_9ZZZZ
MDTAGKNLSRLTNNNNYDGLPCWSPDGKKIAFASDRDGNFEIYIMDADGKNQTRLTNNNVLDNFPSWSPDSTKLAFYSNRTINYQIYIMDADGKNEKCLTYSGGVNPRWQPILKTGE